MRLHAFAGPRVCARGTVFARATRALVHVHVAVTTAVAALATCVACACATRTELAHVAGRTTRAGGGNETDLGVEKQQVSYQNMSDARAHVHRLCYAMRSVFFV